MLSSLVTYAVGDAIPVKTLRILRVLRPLRTIQRLPGLKLVITVILQSLPAIKYVCIIGFGMMIVLGITGMELFLGQMASCTLAGGEDTRDPLTDKSNLDKAACLEQGGVWRANRFNFDNIGQAIITIFIISTGDNWQDIMYVAMDSTGDDTAPERDANKGAAAFFVFSILFAMMLWANLFVSALVDNFTTLASAGVTLTTEKQREWQATMRWKLGTQNSEAAEDGTRKSQLGTKQGGRRGERGVQRASGRRDKRRSPAHSVLRARSPLRRRFLLQGLSSTRD